MTQKKTLASLGSYQANVPVMPSRQCTKRSAFSLVQSATVKVSLKKVRTMSSNAQRVVVAVSYLTTTMMKK